MDADSQLIRRCQAGETGAFRSLVGAYHSYAYALAFRMLWNEQDAEDVVQESFLRVWNNIDRVLGLPHPLETIRSGALLSSLGRFRMPVGIPLLDLKKMEERLKAHINLNPDAQQITLMYRYMVREDKP